MRTALVVVLSMWTVAAWGQTTQPVEALTRELEQVERSEIAQKEKRRNEELNAIHKRYNDEREKWTQAWQAFAETPEYKELQEKRQALQQLRNNKWEEERKQLAERSKSLFQQRHAELQALAAGELVEAPKLGIDLQNYPRVDGSTSTHPLSIVIAARVLGTRYDWIYPEPQGSPWGRGPTVDPTYYLPAQDNMIWIQRHNKDSAFTLASARMVATPKEPIQDRLARIINSYLATSASTHDAYLRLASGECDLNLTVRGPSDDELAAAREKGVEFQLMPIARDALVFMVHADNPVESLTRDELRAIFSLEGRRWENGSEIQPLWRERNSGSRELFDALIAAKAPPEQEVDGRFGRRSLYAMGMSGPYNQLFENRNAIAYSVWYYDRYMSMSPRTRTIPVDGVEPTRAALASGEYPLITTIYAVHRKGEAPDSPTMKLIRWLQSDEGQAVVQESGYMKLPAG